MTLRIPFTILSLALMAAPGTARADIPPPCESDESCGEGRICCQPIGECMDADDEDIDECQVAEGEGEGAAPGEGEGEGEAPAEGEGEGEGEAPAEGEGEGQAPAEGEGEAPTKDQKSDGGCEVSTGADWTGAALTPLLLLGLLIARRQSS